MRTLDQADDVSISVQPGPESVYVAGQVENPITLVYTTDMTLAEALAQVGGIRVTADSDYVLLRRPYHDPLHPDRFRLDVNDTSADASRLVKLVRDFDCHVNVIPFNPHPHAPYRRPTPEAVRAFMERLRAGRIACWLRTPRGDDIAAACGQLAAEERDEPRA